MNLQSLFRIRTDSRKSLSAWEGMICKSHWLREAFTFWTGTLVRNFVCPIQEGGTTKLLEEFQFHPILQNFKSGRKLNWIECLNPNAQRKGFVNFSFTFCNGFPSRHCRCHAEPQTRLMLHWVPLYYNDIRIQPGTSNMNNSLYK